MSFTPPMGIGFTASEGKGALGPPPGLPVQSSRLPRRVRQAIGLVLVLAVLTAVVLLFALTPR
jgi:hypothetical protein